MLIFCLLFMLVFILISVAFFILFEVKSLGSFHLRLGPDSIFFLGVVQPLADFLKLFMKGDLYLSFYFLLFYLFSPCLGVFLSLFVWLNYYSFFYFFFFSVGILFFFFVSSFSVYFLLFSGFYSGSLYSKVGSFRSSSQAVSYEVSMIFVFFCYVFMFFILSFCNLLSEGGCVNYILLSFPLFFCWFFSCLAETGRSPFDFIEGESELVSGFNTEFYSEFFVLIFLCEYSFIMFLCLVTSFIFGFDFYYLSVFFFTFLFIWVRASFPRLRFDMLMMTCWKSILPFVLGCLIYFFFLSFSYSKFSLWSMMTLGVLGLFLILLFLEVDFFCFIVYVYCLILQGFYLSFSWVSNKYQMACQQLRLYDYFMKFFF